MNAGGTDWDKEVYFFILIFYIINDIEMFLLWKLADNFSIVLLKWLVLKKNLKVYLQVKYQSLRQNKLQ